MPTMHDEVMAGYRAAKRDRFRRGQAVTKRRAQWGIPGESHMFMIGYRAYARYNCMVRRA